MHAFAFRPDRKLTDVLSEKRFSVSAEVIPPRNGSEQGRLLEQIHQLIQGGAEFLAVTKGAGGSLRGGSLPIAQLIKERFAVPCIAHFTCRDLTPQEVENQLMDHHYFGIRNILALRGDPPDGQAEWKAREGGYSYAYELIEQIRNLNAGQYLERPGGPGITGERERTDFCIGAAVYPEWPEESQRISYFARKVQAGAEYGITDMLFDPETYARFLDACAQVGVTVPVLPGTRILKSRSQATKMMAKFRVRVPESMLSRLPEEADSASTSGQAGVELFLELSDQLRSYGAPGIHLFVISDTPGAVSALDAMRAVRR